MLNRVSEKIQLTICGWCEDILEVSPESKFYGWVKYGAGMLFISLINTITLLVLIWLVRLPAKNVLIFAITYAILRITSFGVHADSIAVCTLLSMSYYVGGTLLGTYLSIPFPIGIALCLFVAYIFFRYAPAETKKRPLDNNQFLFRLASLLSLLFAIGFYLWFKIQQDNTSANLVLVAMCCQSMNLLPVMYKLLERKEETS